jgi:FkbM family methyltransferase
MKKIIQEIANFFGVKLQKINGRGTLGGALLHLKGKGFSPRYIVDGGASDGRWSLEAQVYFPNAEYLLIEPIVEHIDELKKVPTSAIISAALSDKSGKIKISYINKYNSSIMSTIMSSNSGDEREVMAVTLDSVLKDPQHTLLKLDIEGAEYQVLSASNMLSQVPAVILECAFGNLPKYCHLMEQKGFQVFEIFSANFRRIDGDMKQVDILFLKNNSKTI